MGPESPLVPYSWFLVQLNKSANEQSRAFREVEDAGMEEVALALKAMDEAIPAKARKVRAVFQRLLRHGAFVAYYASKLDAFVDEGDGGFFPMPKDILDELLAAVRLPAAFGRHGTQPSQHGSDKSATIPKNKPGLQQCNGLIAAFNFGLEAADPQLTNSQRHDICLKTFSTKDCQEPEAFKKNIQRYRDRFIEWGWNVQMKRGKDK